MSRLESLAAESCSNYRIHAHIAQEWKTLPVLEFHSKLYTMPTWYASLEFHHRWDTSAVTGLLHLSSLPRFQLLQTYDSAVHPLCPEQMHLRKYLLNLCRDFQPEKIFWFAGSLECQSGTFTNLVSGPLLDSLQDWPSLYGHLQKSHSH